MRRSVTCVKLKSAPQAVFQDFKTQSKSAAFFLPLKLNNGIIYLELKFFSVFALKRGLPHTQLEARVFMLKKKKLKMIVLFFFKI